MTTLAWISVSASKRTQGHNHCRRIKTKHPPRNLESSKSCLVIKFQSLSLHGLHQSMKFGQGSFSLLPSTTTLQRTFGLRRSILAKGVSRETRPWLTVISKLFRFQLNVRQGSQQLQMHHQKWHLSTKLPSVLYVKACSRFSVVQVTVGTVEFAYAIAAPQRGLPK